jgi:hypothetical protein
MRLPSAIVGDDTGDGELRHPTGMSVPIAETELPV